MTLHLKIRLLECGLTTIMFAAVISGISLIGCDSNSYDEDANNYIKHQNDIGIKSVKKISYTKDNRTNLCFAFHNMNGDNAVLTMVPCTPEVEKLLDK